ncbi:toxin-activating lysine-acyltransferase [Salinispirillum sp. LH 10-3-1]|uniref:RTX toxin-activating lysine-acyltransferase n=1 Tax=Salinispirillum sp. LH 10-3-1 TaxID=2952525 RepID=A0AB38YGB7_9GAMM
MDMNNAQVTQASEKEPQSPQEELGYHEAFGIMLWLCSQADYHKTWPLWAVDNDLVPPLIHRQFRIYFDEYRNPVGCATWAWLSEKMKNEMIAGGTLEFDDWASGDHLMFGDYIAPWGHAKSILSDLRTNVFPKETAFSLGRNFDGSVRKVYHWKGKESGKKILVNPTAENKTAATG